MKVNYSIGSEIYILQDPNCNGVLEPRIDNYDIDYDV